MGLCQQEELFRRLAEAGNELIFLDGERTDGIVQDQETFDVHNNHLIRQRHDETPEHQPPAQRRRTGMTPVTLGTPAGSITVTTPNAGINKYGSNLENTPVSRDIIQQGVTAMSEEEAAAFEERVAAYREEQEIGMSTSPRYGSR